ncbi:MAG: hypothetical protein LBD84_04680 [Campylobacteraceae bacterium]|jgi:hypothetical protein|nr:hypothetical protein [Campylobacteraceae bacterium]
MNSKNFSIDFLDDTVCQLRAIAHLFECVFTYADTVGINTRQDLETGYFLSSILRDIAKDIKTFEEAQN